MKKHAVILSLLFVVCASCSSAKDNDQPATVDPSPLGTGMRLRDVQDPANGHAGQTVNVTSVVVTTVDTFDETHDGKSRGTIFVQDADAAKPYGGVSMYSPTFVPANLRLAPGDVVDMNGQYVEESTIGTTVVFPSPDFLPQMNKPQVQQRFEMPLPTPVVIPLTDLEDFANTGRRWIGMLVEIDDVTAPYAPAASDTHGRVTADLTSILDGPAINNELFDLQVNAFPAGTHFTKIIGIVDYFFSMYICPRSAADLVQ